MAEQMTNKEVFNGGLVKAFKDQRHVDVQLKPGDNGDAIPTHKVVLAARSKVFRNMLESDECKASADKIITLSELNHSELEIFLEFLYTGTLSDGKLKQHARSLYLAADKYDIPYLEELCRNQLVASLSSSAALDVFELSEIPADKTLKDAALDFIVQHMEEVVFSDTYEWFVQRNPNLAVQITREFLRNTRANRKAEILTGQSSRFVRIPMRPVDFSSGWT